jgi:xanthine dehydrogenase accessory factor
MNGFWQYVDSELQAGKSVFVAIVVDHSLHSPGAAGAHLAIAETGETRGSIGGGVMEYRLIERAKAALSGERFDPEVKRLVHHRQGPGEKSGMMCAGAQTNLYFLCRPASEGSAIEACAGAEAEDRPGILTVAPSGVLFEAEAEHVSQTPPRNGTTFGHNDLTWRYDEQQLCLNRAAIMGGGHCGRALSSTLKSLGYRVDVFDTRADLATMRSNNDADRRIIVADMLDAASRIEYPLLTDVIVMGTDTRTDIRALCGVLDHPFPFIGAMGSPAKMKLISDALVTEGFSEEQISRVQTPVGVPIGSKTPEEIAVSVAAQLIGRRRLPG